MGNFRHGLAVCLAVGVALATGPALAETPASPPVVAAAAEQVRGEITNLPLPRFVSLKTSEGNARRGPGLTHRIDWVFTRPDMPLRITAEHENWRRVEDAEGAGGWVHYALLSGVRTVLITAPIADFHANPDNDSMVVLRAEDGVVAHVLECTPEWCRLSIDGQKGWVRKVAFWGVDPDEIIE